MLECKFVHHQSINSQPVEFACISADCKSTFRLCCYQCIQEYHADHVQQVLKLNYIGGWLQTQKQTLELANQKMQQLSQMMSEKIIKINSIINQCNFRDQQEVLTLNYTELNQKITNLMLVEGIKSIVYDQSLSQQIEQTSQKLENTLLQLKILLNIDDKKKIGSQELILTKQNSQIEEIKFTKEFYFDQGKNMAIKGIEQLLNTKTEVAKNKFNQALLIDQKYLQAKVWKAYSCYLIGQFDDSITLSKEVFKEDPTYSRAYLICGYSLLRLNDHYQTKIAFTKALKYFPTEKVAIAEQGLILVQKGALESAIEWFDKSIQLDTKAPSHFAIQGGYEASLKLRRPDLEQRYSALANQYNLNYNSFRL